MKKLNVLLAVAAFSVILFFGGWYLLNLRYNHSLKGNITNQVERVFGRNFIISFSEPDKVYTFQIERQRLLKSLEFYDELIHYQWVANGVARYSDKTLHDFKTQKSDLEFGKPSGRYRYIRNGEESFAYDMARRIRDFMTTNPNMFRERYDSLLKESSKYPPINCLIAETKTLVAKAERGDYFDMVDHEVYQVTIEMPVSAKISYFGEFKVYVYDDEVPDISKQLNTMLADAVKFKAENNCK